MNNLIVKQIKLGGEVVPVVGSKEVSEMLGKEHKNLLRDIKGYVEILESSNLSSRNFFIEDFYINSQNKSQPCFQLTKKGCDMVANKMSGKKGVLFTAEYVTKFEEMEKSLIQRPKLLTAKEELKLHYEVLEDHEEKINKIDNKIDNLENNMPLFNVECKELQALVRKKGIEVLGGKGRQAYKDNSLRGKVYSDIQQQLRREFQITRYEAIKRSQLNIAKEIVKTYKAPLVLSDEIIKINNQLSFVEGI